MIWLKKFHKNLEFFQNALTFLFLRVKHSDSERFPIRSQTLVSEHFHAYFRSETVNVEGSIIILQLSLQKTWFDWYADFVLNLSWCFRLDSRWLNFNDLPLVTKIFVLHHDFVSLCSEMYVSDLIRNLSKYEKITLKNKKVREHFPAGDFFWTILTILTSDPIMIFTIGFITGHSSDLVRKTTVNAQKRAFQIWLEISPNLNV